MSAPATRIWQGIEAEDPPCLRRDYPELRAMADKLYESRRASFPALVDDGQLTADEAARQLALFEQIAAHWRWIITGQGEPAPHATLYDRTDALDESLRTIAGIARERGDFDTELAHQAHCVIALRWHHEHAPEACTRALARLTHQCRRDAALKRDAASGPENASTEAVDA